MNSIGCFVWRNGVAIAIAAEQLRITDLVLTTTGHYVPAVEITRLREGTYAQVPTPGIANGLVVAGLFLGVAWLLAECFKPPSRSRPFRKNNEPVEAWKKDYVSERDAWRCTYCDRSEEHTSELQSP